MSTIYIVIVMENVHGCNSTVCHIEGATNLLDSVCLAETDEDSSGHYN